MTMRNSEGWQAPEPPHVMASLSQLSESAHVSVHWWHSPCNQFICARSGPCLSKLGTESKWEMCGNVR